MGCSSRWASCSEYTLSFLSDIKFKMLITKKTTWLFFPPYSQGAVPTLTCSCGSSPGSIWRGHGSVQTRATAVNQLLLPWPLTKIWPGVKFWCPMLWRGWVGLPHPPPPALHPPSHPSRTRTLPVNIAIRSHGRITQQWSSGWWWRPDRGQS